MGKKTKAKHAPLTRAQSRGRPATAGRRRAGARRAVDGIAGLRSRIKQVEAERDMLRRALASKDEQLGILSERVDRLSSRDADLRALLLVAHERLTGDQRGGRDEKGPAGNGSASRAVVSPSGATRAATYRQLVARIREVVRDAVLPDSTVVVVSKGDEELLKLGDGRRGWHFPQTASGVYAGHHPPDDAAALQHLESLRAKGGQYLLFPATAFWWFEHYREFKEYLDARYAVIPHDSCVVYKLFQSKGHR